MMAGPLGNASSVLVIDDDEVMRELLGALLGARGYDVATVESAAEAFRALADSTPDVVLTDLHLPEIEGAELVGRLRELRAPGTLLLGMSASEPEEHVKPLLQGFLLKPFGAEQFEGAVERAKNSPSVGAKEPAGTPPAADRTEAGAAATVLDESVYAKLAAALPPAQLRELYRISLDDVAKRTEVIRRAAAEGDKALCRSEAHAIKGCCGMVGAVELKALAAAMEAGAAVDTLMLDEMNSARERLQRMLDTLP